MVMIKNKLKEFIYKRYNISFSKAGDDIQLRQLLKSKNPGVYVDIGCWHPVNYSNTYYFYLRGWKGLCIDPNPELIELFKYKRRTDNFINCAVGNNQKSMNYYMLDKRYNSMNTLDYEFIQKHKLTNHIINQIVVPVKSLKSILDSNLSENDRLDFFDVDVEGQDLEVLKSNDWNKYRPHFIMVETNLSLNDELTSETVLYLRSVGYEIIGKSVINDNLGNLFFKNTQLIN